MLLIPFSNLDPPCGYGLIYASWPVSKGGGGGGGGGGSNSRPVAMSGNGENKNCGPISNHRFSVTKSVWGEEGYLSTDSATGVATWMFFQI